MQESRLHPAAAREASLSAVSAGWVIAEELAKRGGAA
jgi:hypothetical protein